MSETTNHKILKIKSLEYLVTVKRCKYFCTELKIGDYIFDCIGTDGTDIYILESKQAHEDFLADCNKLEEIKENIRIYKSDLEQTGDLKEYKKKVENERSKSWKFYDDSLMKLSSERYIIAPEDLIKSEEVPSGWGLLEVLEDGSVIKEKQCAHTKDFNPRFRDLVIKEIARKQSKNYLMSIGVKFDEKVIEFPKLLLEQESE